MGDFLLIKELKEDDQNVAWTRVYKMFKKMIKDYINVCIPDYMFLDDMVLEVFKKNIGKCGGVKTMGELKGRLIITAKHLIADYYNAQKGKKKISKAELAYYENMLADEDIQDFIKLDAEKMNLIVMAILEEPEKRKEVGVYLLKGWSVNKISEKMGISIQTVHRHKYDLIESIQKKLGSDLSKNNLLSIMIIFLIRMLF